MLKIYQFSSNFHWKNPHFYTISSRFQKCYSISQNSHQIWNGTKSRYDTIGTMWWVSFKNILFFSSNLLKYTWIGLGDGDDEIEKMRRKDETKRKRDETGVGSTERIAKRNKLCVCFLLPHWVTHGNFFRKICWNFGRRRRKRGAVQKRKTWCIYIWWGGGRLEIDMCIHTTFRICGYVLREVGGQMEQKN